MKLDKDSAMHYAITSKFPFWGVYLCIAFTYFLSARFGLLLATLNNHVSPVWPPTGIAFAVLLIFGNRYWSALFIGAWVANYLTGTPLIAVTIIAAGNTAEAIIGATIISKLSQDKRNFEALSEAVSILVASLLATLVSATAGVLALTLTKTIPWENFGPVWVTWWVGDMLGGLVLTPAILKAFSNEKKVHSHSVKNRLVESVFAAVAIVATTYLLFFYSTKPEALFILFAVLLYTTFRWNEKDNLLFAVYICSTAIYATTKGFGPFAGEKLNDDLIFLQLFLGSFSFTALVLNGIRRAGSLLRPSIILVMGWVASAFILHAFEKTRQNEYESLVSTRVAEGGQEFARKLEEFNRILYSAAAFIKGSSFVDIGEWADFNQVARFTDQQNLIYGVGYIENVAKNKVPALTKRLKEEYGSHLEIHNVAQSVPILAESKYIITRIFPVERNNRAIGLDIGSEQFRKVAAEEAARLRTPVLTKRIKLVQDNKARIGFLLLNPVFKEDKGETLVGWTYIPLVAENLAKHAAMATGDDLRLSVFEGTTPTKENLIYSNEESSTEMRFARVTQIEFGSRQFALGWNPTGTLQPKSTALAGWAASAGALMSLLLACVVSSLQGMHARAEILAEQQTKKLFVAEEKNRLTLENALDGIVHTDRFGKVISWNRQAEVIFQWNKTEILGKHLVSLVVPQENQVQEIKSIEKYIATGEMGVLNQRHEMDLHKKNGERFTAEVNVTPVKGENEIYFAVFIRDLTEQKKLEESIQLERSKNVISSKMAALGEMAGGIAHEINNPLAVIQGKAQTMRMAFESGREVPIEKRVESLKKIEDTCLRISKIIKGLRSLARNSDADPLVPTKLSVVLENTLELCRERFRSHAVDLRVTASSDSEILAREVQLGQVLLNLLNNAFDAVETLPNPWVEVKIEEQGKKVFLTITDCGKGIPKEVADKIMMPFFTTKAVGKGTGLGLSITRNIIEEHKGRFYLDTNCPNTRFVIELERYTESQKAAA